MLEQRLGHSAVPELSLEENILLSIFNINFNKNNIIDFKYLESFTNKVIKDFNVNALQPQQKLDNYLVEIFKNLLLVEKFYQTFTNFISVTWGIDV